MDDVIKELTESLTAKQKMFCEEYLVDFNGTRSAIASGYSENTAATISSENLIKPNIRAYIKHLTEKRNERVHVDVDYVLKNLKKVVRMTTRENNLGNIDATGANKSLELIGKHLGMFIEKVETTQNITVQKTPQINFNDDETTE